MRYLEDPRQSELFDVFADILAPVAYRRLTSGWQHVFRQAILKLMPAGKLAEHFDPQLGRPTKELYSMAGLLFIMEFRNWTHEEAADAYMFNIDSQYALNLQPENQSLCRRTIAHQTDLTTLCKHGRRRNLSRALHLSLKRNSVFHVGAHRREGNWACCGNLGGHTSQHRL